MPGDGVGYGGPPGGDAVRVGGGGADAVAPGARRGCTGSRSIACGRSAAVVVVACRAVGQGAFAGGGERQDVPATAGKVERGLSGRARLRFGL